MTAEPRLPADPPIRADGRCAECWQPRGRGAKNPRARAAAKLDAFCSTECCRRWHRLAA